MPSTRLWRGSVLPMSRPRRSRRSYGALSAPREPASRTRVERHLTGYRIDHDQRRRRQSIAASIGAHAGADIEQITVPWAAQPAVLLHGILERSEPVRANRAVRDERSILELDKAERLPVDLDEQRQPLPQFAQGAEGERTRKRLPPGPRTPRQSFPAHHHRLVLVPQTHVARPVLLAECGQPVRPTLRQIKPHLDCRPLRSERLQQSPNFCSGTVAREGARAVPRIRPVDLQLEKHPPTR